MCCSYCVTESSVQALAVGLHLPTVTSFLLPCDVSVLHQSHVQPWAEWESWGFCSTTCGVGQRTRRRQLCFYQFFLLMQRAVCCCFPGWFEFQGRQILGLRGIDGHGCYEALGEVQVARVV